MEVARCRRRRREEGRQASRGGGGGGNRVARSSRRGIPVAEGRSQTLAGRGFNCGPGPATRWKRRRSYFGTKEMRVSVAAPRPRPRGGGVGPTRSRGVAVTGAAAPSLGAGRGLSRPASAGRNGGRARGLVGGGRWGAGAERAGSALSHGGRPGPGLAWPGRGPGPRLRTGGKALLIVPEAAALGRQPSS